MSVQKLKALDDENARPKKPLAEAMLNNTTLNGVVSKMKTSNVKWNTMTHICAQPASGVRGSIGGTVEHTASQSSSRRRIYFRVLAGMEDFTRKCLCLVANTLLSGVSLACVMDIARRGKPTTSAPKKARR
ncbi:UNVERIFIED_ORG: hypothetical protein BCL66_10621 [Martelella mediterranea]